MKQYKFKYKGKWHDILCVPGGKFKGEAIADTCFGAPDEYHFRVLESSLPKLLATLRKLNIEVAEVCDKVKWANNNSQTVFVKSKPNAIRYCAFQFESGVYTPVIQDHDCHNLLIIGKPFTTPKAAKAACQADFQKRRAK